ncbi:MAG TPA: cytochrome P450 [Polyangia bacterium]|jgi:cytochrome P450|nr:cytochrome P450 [Polyangia bacterium]
MSDHQRVNRRAWPVDSIAATLALPLRQYRELRAAEAVVYESRFNSWNVHRYADAVRIFNEPALFSSEMRGQGGMALPSIVGMDGARHRKLRGLVTQAFTPRMVSQLAGRITEITAELLDAGIARGRFDAMQDFAYPLPIRIIADMLGIPVEDQSTFRRWSETLIAGPRTDVLRGKSFAEERAATLLEMNDYMARQIEARRRSPQEDLITRLLAAEVDGERLTENELQEFCRLLLIAGYETTACLIGNGVLTLHELPGLADELRADPSLLAGATEEIIRCFPSVAGSVRVALADVEVGGQKVDQGQTVIVWAGSTNYDETIFPDAEQFDSRRSPNRHLGFGLGPHFCLGAPLARLEVRTALQLLLEKLPRLERDPGTAVEPVDSPFLLGVKRFPLIVA